MTETSDEEPDLDGPAWRFAVDLYARPGVASACLALQDETGIDVPEFLTVLHLVAIGRRDVDRTTLDAARVALGDWRERTVLPLRALRRRLRSPSDACPTPIREHLRSEIKAAELLAERIQIALLERHFLRRPPPPTVGSLRPDQAVAMVLRSTGEAPIAPPAAIVDALTEVLVMRSVRG